MGSGRGWASWGKVHVLNTTTTDIKVFLNDPPSDRYLAVPGRGSLPHVGTVAVQRGPAGGQPGTFWNTTQATFQAADASWKTPATIRVPTASPNQPHPVAIADDVILCLYSPAEHPATVADGRTAGLCLLDSRGYVVDIPAPPDQRHREPETKASQEPGLQPAARVEEAMTDDNGGKLGKVYVYNLFNEPATVKLNGGQPETINAWDEEHGYAPAYICVDSTADLAKKAGHVYRGEQGSNLLDIRWSSGRANPTVTFPDGDRQPLTANLVCYIAQTGLIVTTSDGCAFEPEKPGSGGAYQSFQFQPAQ